MRNFLPETEEIRESEPEDDLSKHWSTEIERNLEQKQKDYRLREMKESQISSNFLTNRFL